jgi:hypothetical protein
MHHQTPTEPPDATGGPLAPGQRTGTCPWCDHHGTQTVRTDKYDDRDAECQACGANWSIGPAPDTYEDLYPHPSIWP